ncbi:MAG TPA: hypothetical protein VIV11_05180 [Kofleriaceae bacterium]
MGRIWLLVICVACARGSSAGGGAGGGDDGEATFSITYPDAPPTGTSAKAGKRFYAKPVGRCLYENGREARWTIGGARVTSGDLPPGLTLEDGVIGGVPTTSGLYAFHIEFSSVTCAGKPYEGQAVDVQITVK